MIWRHRGAQLSLEHYHGVPKGWNADDIFAQHAAMKGQFPISDFVIGKWGAPSWMTNRYEWLRYKATLNRVADGVRADDAACVEIAVRYIELRYIGSYSGFLRAKLARGLKTVELSERQKDRLNAHFLKLVIERDYTEEFRAYRAVWERIVDRKTIEAVRGYFEKQSGHGYTRSDTWLPKLVAAFEDRQVAVRR
jgi:hypothetical protein